MSADKSLIQFILDLLRDPGALAEFQDDPEAALRACGLAGVGPEDVHDAIVLARDDETGSDRGHHTGGGHPSAGAGVPPPPPVEAQHGQPDHEAAIRYIDTYVTNNYVTNHIDDRDTLVDHSVNQNIDTHGGDVHQSFTDNSVTASGDGAVAAGGDIEDSTVTTGNGNVVGDDNAVVRGDDNTTAFGSGSSLSDVRAENGGTVSGSGPAAGNDSTTDSFDRTHTESYSDTRIEDSYDTDSSNHVDTDVDDHSTTHTDVASHNHLAVDVA